MVATGEAPPGTPRTLARAGENLMRGSLSSRIRPGQLLGVGDDGSNDASSPSRSVVEPASPSMFESSLHAGQGFVNPQLGNLSMVRSALETDAVRQRGKYGTEEPCVKSARFHVPPPTGPQHAKYSWQQKQAEVEANQIIEAHSGKSSPARTKGSKLTVGTRFNLRTLQTWFKQLDRNGSGSITQRELIVALQKQKQLQAMFYEVQGFEESGPPARSVNGVEAKVTKRKEEIHRIKQILVAIDEDGNGCMEWNEFVDFFRRAGLLLEYKTPTQEYRNRTSLCDLILAQQLEKQREEAEQDGKNGNSRTLTGQSLLTAELLQRQKVGPQAT